MRVFVTGATGFIGGAIVRQIAPRHTLLAMSRSPAGDDTVRKLGAEPVRSDLLALAPGDLPACDAVVHCAAWAEPWGRREDYWRANVEGTERVLAAARRRRAPLRPHEHRGRSRAPRP